jgi:hypothetical protein
MNRHKTHADMIDVDKKLAIEQFMLRVTIPIFCRTARGISTGTGTLFEIGDECFLVTARHIFDNLEAEHWEIPDNPTDARSLALGRFVLHRPTDEAIDIAVLELQENNTIDAIRKGWRLLTPEHAAIASPQGTFLLCGYPSERLQMSKGRLCGSPISGYTERLKEVPENAEAPVDERLDLFFHHNTQATNISGELISTPRLGGTSGSSFWEYNEPVGQSVWTPESALRIIGIQHSFRRGEFIRAKSWEFVRALLRKIDPPPVPVS